MALLFSAAAHADELPLNWSLGGYYRTRLLAVNGLPTNDPLRLRDNAANATYGFMRLRLNPTLSYGPDEKLPIVALKMQIDGLDNVVFGDNDLVADTPVFGDLPSDTNIDGVDIETVRLRRAWLEFLVPVGLMRVGRMPTQWGLGLLAHDGNGMRGDFGDALRATTNDRIMFATRPLSVANALMGKSSRSTPLILVTAYDKIVEDPFLESTDVRYDPTSGDQARSNLPFGTFLDDEDDVNQVVVAAVWNDKKFNRAVEGDELTAGVYFTYRWQNSSQSKVPIIDFFWRLKWSVFGADAPRLYTEGEVLTIQGQSRAISEGTLTEPDIWGAVARVGLQSTGWDAILEGGHASGDDRIGDSEFTGRSLNSDYRVGLLLYPVLLNARTANQTPSSPALWSRGGVYNSTYFYPHGRWRPLDNVEVVAALLVAWADELAPQLGGSQRDDGTTTCSVGAGDCMLGIEADAAVKVRWGPDDLMRWSTEFGILKTGKALEPVLTQDLLWTLQTRLAMVW